MRGWGFAFSRRWLSYLALAVAFAVGCSLLATWQFARRDEALAKIERIDQNYHADARPLAAVLAAPGTFQPDQEWTPVVVTGQYLHDEQLLVRNRPFAGKPGFEVLTPLQLADGSVFVINRGWVPAGSQDAPDAVPAAPSGTVTVEARLRPGEPTIPGRSAPEGQIATVHLPDVAERVGATTYTAAYGQLASEDPAPATRPAAALEPARDAGPHFSYALQWFMFALLGFLGLAYAVREEYRFRNADEPAERARAAERERKARARAPSDDEIEDSILDARSTEPVRRG